MGEGDGEAAWHCSEREKGGVGLEELPQGERRDIVLRGGGEKGEAAVNCSEREQGRSPGLKSCRRASVGKPFCAGADNMVEEGLF